ncbi:MAG TPA: hypothetical protein VMY76_14100 [Gemmatimonadales bacterium]|nr:hypothetical protein [Gemmatimonadales bacterium]
MLTEPLGVYLNDHLAGSVAALRMMDELAERERGKPLEATLRALHAEVSEEQGVLRELLARIETDENRLKQAAAWVAEKVGQGKLALSARTHPDLATLQGLESLVLGLHGKLSLYRALGEIALSDQRLAGYDFHALAGRTLEQQTMVEGERVTAARSALRSAAREQTPDN